MELLLSIISALRKTSCAWEKSPRDNNDCPCPTISSTSVCWSACSIGSNFDHQIIERLEALVRLLAQALAHHVFEFGRNSIGDLAERHRLFVQNLVDDGSDVSAIERLPVGEELVHHDPNREDVGASIDVLPVHLLGRGVLDRAHENSGLGHGRGFHVHDPEVHHLDLAFVIDQNVRGLNVAMNQAVPVGIIQPLTKLRNDLELAGQRHGRPAGNRFLEALALDELHGDERLARGLAEIELVNGDDIGMFQAAARARLFGETLQQLRIREQIGIESLERHDAANAWVASLINCAHATLAQLLQDLELPELLGYFFFHFEISDFKSRTRPLALQ